MYAYFIWVKQIETFLNFGMVALSPLIFYFSQYSTLILMLCQIDHFISNFVNF